MGHAEGQGKNSKWRGPFLAVLELYLSRMRHLFVAAAAMGPFVLGQIAPVSAQPCLQGDPVQANCPGSPTYTSPQTDVPPPGYRQDTFGTRTFDSPFGGTDSQSAPGNSGNNGVPPPN